MVKMTTNEAAEIWFRNKTPENEVLVIDSFSDYCYRHASRMARKLKRRHLAEDFYQEAMVGVVKAMRVYDGRVAFFVYARYWINTQLINYMRKFFRINTSIDTMCEDGESWDVPDENAESVDRQVYVKMLLESVKDLYMRYDDYRKDIMTRCIVTDFPRNGQDVAEDWGVSREAIRQIKVKLRKDLDFFLKKEGWC